MTASPFSSLIPFAWVAKRDGRLVPFEADKICRALFAATETLGHPDAFLARELTDSILHFLAAEITATTPSTAEIAELVVKVVRELGQPALAQAFADFARTPQRRHEQTETPLTAAVPVLEQAAAAQLAPWIAEGPAPAELAWRAGEILLRQYSLEHVFTRDLIAAQAEGLLTLTGLETPLELAGGVLPVLAGGCEGDVLHAVEEARHWAGSFVAIDGPEHGLADLPASREQVVDFVHELKLGLRLTQLRAVVNLNGQVPPSWAYELAEGPLFAGQRRTPPLECLSDLAETVLEQVLLPTAGAPALRVDWHLGERDFLPAVTPRLVRLARLALSGAALAFVFDRVRRPVSLAEGVDRRHPAVLLAVGLHLPRLVEVLGRRADPSLFLQKLGSLARLALSAALQKREFLRRHSQHRPELTRGFLLERARLVVTPIGLDEAARTLVGEGSQSGGPGHAFVRRVLQQLHSCLRADGAACQLETCLDNGPLTLPGPKPERLAVPESNPLPWESLNLVKAQLRASSPLHALAELGTVWVLASEEYPPTAEEVAQLLASAWKQTEVVRVRFLRLARAQRQLTAPWAQETSRKGDEEGPYGRVLLNP